MWTLFLWEVEFDPQAHICKHLHKYNIHTYYLHIYIQIHMHAWKYIAQQLEGLLEGLLEESMSPNNLGSTCHGQPFGQPQSTQKTFINRTKGGIYRGINLHKVCGCLTTLLSTIKCTSNSSTSITFSHTIWGKHLSLP